MKDLHVVQMATLATFLIAALTVVGMGLLVIT